MTPPAWHHRAACRGADHNLFFPEDAGPAGAATAAAICAGCPVTTECAAAGADEPHGIWAGTTPDQRRTLRRTAGGTR